MPTMNYICKWSPTDWRRRAFRVCVWVLAIAWMAPIMVACNSLPKKLEISGRYENPGSGEYIEFLANGKLLYSISADNVPTALRKDQPFMGQYRMLDSGAIQLALNSVHIGLIHVEMSDTQDKLYVEHRISGRVVTFVRVGPDITVE